MGAGGSDCEPDGGSCVAGATGLSGHDELELCVGGSRDGEMCNAAIGCECPEGWQGAHCEDAIIICDQSASGRVTHYCLTDYSVSCLNATHCDCFEGYGGDHCDELLVLGSDTTTGKWDDMGWNVGWSVIRCMHCLVRLCSKSVMM